MYLSVYKLQGAVPKRRSTEDALRIREKNVNWVQFFLRGGGGLGDSGSEDSETGKQRDTGRETDRWDVKLPLRGFVLVPKLSQHLTDTPHCTRKDTDTNTLWYDSPACPTQDCV